MQKKLNKKQKGITLIALIITIIVMLILVGVTINVALNGGLFETARTGETGTKKAMEREELISIAIAAYDATFGEVKTTDLNFNGKYTEETDKTTTEKIVVKGQSGTLWEINLKTAEVEEYKEGKGIAYGKKYLNTENSGLYIILSEDGKVQGTALPPDTEEMFYKVQEEKTEEYTNALYVSTTKDGDYAFQGYFDADFTEIKIPDADDNLMIFRLEGVTPEEPSLYKVPYEFIYNDQLYYSWIFYEGGTVIFDYSYPSKYFAVGLFEFDSETNKLTITADNTTKELFLDDQMNFMGEFAAMVRSDSTYSLDTSAEPSEKGVYINAIYKNKNGSSDITITVSSEIIVISSINEGSARATIKLEDFDPETNETITVNSDGTVITYDEIDYELISEEDL